MSKIQEFRDYREKMNKSLLEKDNKIIKRLYSLDTITYQSSALDQKTKEMLGLVSSMVLRCDDCVKYHLEQCHQLGINTNEIMDIFGVANVVGGTIVIPHTRKALEYWELLEKSKS